MLSKEFQESEQRTVRTQQFEQLGTLSLQAGHIDTDIEFLDKQDSNSELNLDRDLPTCFGDYILLKLLGRGSFGLVYLARRSSKTFPRFLEILPGFFLWNGWKQRILHSRAREEDGARPNELIT